MQQRSAYFLEIEACSMCLRRQLYDVLFEDVTHSIVVKLQSEVSGLARAFHNVHTLRNIMQGLTLT